MDIFEMCLVKEQFDILQCRWSRSNGPAPGKAAMTNLKMVVG